MGLNLTEAGPQGELDEATIAFLREELIRSVGDDEYWRVERVEQPQTEESLVQPEPGAYQPDAENAPEPETAPEPKPEPEPQPSPGGDAGTASDTPRRERYVRTGDIEPAVKGRGADVLHNIGVLWNGGHDHIRCPLPGHEDRNPSWRWDEDKGCCFCTCDGTGSSIFTIVMRVEGIDFDAAKVRVAAILGRDDLIVDPAEAQGVTLAQIAEAKSLPVEELRKAGWFDLPRRGKYHDKPPAIGISYRDRGDDMGAKSRWLRIRTALTGHKRFALRKGDVAKYGALPLYGAWNLVGEPPKYIMLVEGESDCLTLWISGIPALGVPGAPNGWNEERHSALLDGIEHVVLVVEPGGAGAELLKRLAGSIIAPRLRVIYMPVETKDPSALWCLNPDPAAFHAAFMAMLNAAEPLDPEKQAPPKSEPAQGKTRSQRSRDEDQADGPVSPRGLPVIEYAGGKLAEATDKAERILAAADHEIFQRSDFLVRLGMAEDMTAADGEKIKGPRLVTVGAMHLQDRMNRVIEFMKFDAKLDDYKPINPPRDVAEALRQRIGLWRHIPIIDGIASAPIFRADGTILDQPGFDPATHIYYAPTPGVVFCPIPPKPTKEQARAALDTLCDLIGEFPFIQENGDPATGQPSPSRSVTLSGLITPMVRRAILSAPIHGFDATEAGSGKSKLCSLPSIIARGHAAPVIPGGTALNPEEFEKKISTSLIAADAIVVVDNVEGRISSELLCSAATERMLYIRVLGLSKNILVPNGATFFVNGNGLTIVGDLVRRSLRAGLDPKVDRPELRSFEKPDPVLRAMRDRPVYVAAVLTILRAFHVAGRPKQTEPLGSFEDWSRLVRDALIWLGERDPCETMERTRKQDPRRKSLADILYWWDAIIGRGEITAKRVIEYAEEREPGDYDTPAMTLRYPEFREALMAVAAGKTGSVDPVRFGQWLGRNQMRFIDGLRIEPGLALDHSGSGRWKVVPA